MFVVVLLFVVITFVVFLQRLKNQKRRYPEPPTYPGALPILGHALKFLGDPVDVWKTLKEASYYSVQKGGVAKFLLGPMSLYIVTDPDDFLTVANKCLDRAYYYRYAKQWAGNGLITSDVPEWKKNRKLFHPAFTQRALYCFLNIFNNQSRRLVDQLAPEIGKDKFDHYWYLLSNLLETVNQTTLGLKYENSNMIDKNYVQEVTQLYDTYIERVQKVWLQLTFLYNRSSLKRRHDKIINKMKDKSCAVIRKRRSEFQATENTCVEQNRINDTSSTVLDLILERSIHDKVFSEDEIRQHLETFIVASFDTTGTTLVYLLKLLGCHPTTQNRLLKEIEEVFGKSDRDVEKDDLSKLIYLEAVAKETIRLYPVGPFIARSADKDVKLKNYTIPSGSTIVGSIYGLNHHPTWGDDVEEFKPERWLKSECSSTEQRRFAGFSLGRRNCIGEVYALTVIKISIVHILRRYRIIADNTEMLLKYNSFLKPVSGHHIALELRS